MNTQEQVKTAVDMLTEINGYAFTVGVLQTALIEALDEVPKKYQKVMLDQLTQIANKNRK